jgi:hypothetical protein
MDEADNDLLILLLVARGGILRVLEEIHGVGRLLGGERVEDRMKHGCSEGAVYGRFVEDAEVALVKLEDGLVPEDSSSIWVLRITTRRASSGVVEVEDAVGWLCSVDTAQEFDIFVVVGSWKVAVEC